METIKAVRMVRQIRDAQYILTKDMSNEEFISYIRKKAKLVNDQPGKVCSPPGRNAPQA